MATHNCTFEVRPASGAALSKRRPILAIHKPNHLSFGNSSGLLFPSHHQPLLRKVQHILKVATQNAKKIPLQLLDAFVDFAFEIVDQPWLPTQSNFAPVQELEQPFEVAHTNIEGTIPNDFPEGVYVRNGPNPLFGGYKSAISIFGKSSHIWVEGEGMLHALYFRKSKNNDSSWNIVYNNRYVESQSYKYESQKGKLAFLPAAEGDPAALVAAHILNLMRFGMVDKYLSNTNVIEHAKRFYATAENHVPFEIDIKTLETLGKWDFDGTWKRPFTSHAKKVQSTGELVTFGFYPQLPYYELGIISADGKKLVHKVDLKFKRCTLSHDIGITERYNVIMDFPLVIDINRLLTGGPLIKFEKEEEARIGVMPRYGDGDSIMWFKVEVAAVFHILNCFEDADEVVVIACKANGSVIPGPDFGSDKLEWFSRGFKHIMNSRRPAAGSQRPEDDHDPPPAPEDGLLFTRLHEWRLNLGSGEVKARYLTNTEFSMDFPFINDKFTGIRNKYGFTQLLDSAASSISGMAKYGGLAKIHLDEVHPGDEQIEEAIKVEYHKFPQGTYCSGATFVPRFGSNEEDDGWIIVYVHDETIDKSGIYIIDAKKMGSEPIAKIKLPYRVPYGFHGAFMQG